MDYEVIVIGGSAAASSAGIYLARQRVKFLMLCDKFGGNLPNLTVIQNYPGIDSISGIDLAKKFKDHLSMYGPKIGEGVVVKSVKPENDLIRVEAEKGNEKLSYTAKAVIIATGSNPKKLNIPGEEEFFQKGLSYCSLCDGYLFKDKKVAVIGGGNSANEAGLLLSRLAQEVYILTKYPEMKGEEVLIEQLKKLNNVKIIPNTKIKQILGDKLVTGLEYIDVSTNEVTKLDVNGIFIYVGFEPNSAISPDVLKNEKGEIKINYKCETSVPGIFAAGDVTDMAYKQIAIASGYGAIAALSATEYIGKKLKYSH